MLISILDTYHHEQQQPRGVPEICGSTYNGHVLLRFAWCLRHEHTTSKPHKDL